MQSLLSSSPSYVVSYEVDGGLPVLAVVDMNAGGIPMRLYAYPSFTPLVKSSQALFETPFSYVNEPMLLEVAAFLTAYFTLDPRLNSVFRCFCLWANNRRVTA